LLNLLQITVGLALLYYGGNFLVTGSIRLSRSMEISPFIIGSTVIAFGTSAPELAVAILAALDDTSELAMGNIIGSNIANIGLVLGLTALICNISIAHDRLIRESTPLILSSVLILIIAWNLKVSRIEGFFMVCLLGLYIKRSLNQKEEFSGETEDETHLFAEKKTAFQTLLIVLGLIFLVGGAKLLVEGGVLMARNMGISEWFIGITIVSVGTSLPEIVSSLIAAKRGHGEMAIGNIFGSNIFNILMVLGLTATIHPLQINEPIQPDLTMVTVVTGLLLAMLAHGKHSLGKWKGIVLLLSYFIYIGLKGSGTL
jgi:cation:H+ antiporter